MLSMLISKAADVPDDVDDLAQEVVVLPLVRECDAVFEVLEGGPQGNRERVRTHLRWTRVLLGGEESIDGQRIEKHVQLVAPLLHEKLVTTLFLFGPFLHPLDEVRFLAGQRAG